MADVRGPLSSATLHHAIIESLVERGCAPELQELSEQLGAAPEEVREALERLHAEHGVVLHPGTAKVWIAHPFSTAPTGFLVRSEHREWWANCAWCALGAAVVLDRDVDIVTTLGADSRQVTLSILDGQLQQEGYFVHFPVPMREAWENVVYTCSVMLLFESEPAVDAWCARHHVRKGDVQPLAKVWELAKIWYGGHARPDWRKWSVAEAREIFTRVGLCGEIWELPASEETF